MILRHGASGSHRRAQSKAQKGPRQEPPRPRPPPSGPGRREDEGLLLCYLLFIIFTPPTRPRDRNL